MSLLLCANVFYSDASQTVASVTKTTTSDYDGGVTLPRKVYKKSFEKYRPIKKNTGEGHVLDCAEYAWKISGGDFNFVKKLDSENGAWDINAINYNNNGTTDKGIGQINSIHKGIRNNQEWEKSWKKQIETAYELYKGGTKFYAPVSRVQHLWSLEEKDIPCPEWIGGC